MTWMPETVSDVSGTLMVEVGRAGLLEVTPASTVGELLSQQTDDEGVTTLWFEATMLGYPGWHWTVSMAQLPDEAPTVLETELLPGDGALLAPDWVPWSDRLEDYKAAQAAIAAGELAAIDDQADDDDDEDEHGDDDLGDDELGDDDLGDDPDDGIDFESDELSSVSAPVGVDEQDQPDAEADEDGPEPPAAPVRKQRRKKEQ